MTDDPASTDATAGTEAIALLPEAVRRFTDVVAQIPADAWNNPSPCAGWNGRDVLNHLVAEHLWAPHLLRGETVAAVGDRYDGDVLSVPGRPEAPQTYAQRWVEVSEASLAAWAQADAAEQVHTSRGRLPAAEYAEQMLLDLTVHAWDLAQTVNAPLEVDDYAVDLGLRTARGFVDPEGMPGLFDAPIFLDDSEDPTPMQELLALLGRQPRSVA